MLWYPYEFDDTEEENYPSSYTRNICEEADKAKRNAFKRAMSVDNRQNWVSKPSISPTFWSLNVVINLYFHVIMILCSE